jgi:hypothetical protein
MTALAGQAVDLADMFDAIFAERFGGLRIDLAKPGMSTAGGKQSTQHIGLHAQGGGTLVVGKVDAGSHCAELRSHARVNAMHEQRFGTGMSIKAVDWNAFLDRAETFFRREGFRVSREPDDLESAAETSPVGAASRGVWLWVAILLAVLLAVVAVAATVILSRRGEVPAVVPEMPAAPTMPATPAMPEPRGPRSENRAPRSSPEHRVPSTDPEPTSRGPSRAPNRRSERRFDPLANSARGACCSRFSPRGA